MTVDKRLKNRESSPGEPSEDDKDFKELKVSIKETGLHSPVLAVREKVLCTVIQRGESIFVVSGNTRPGGSRLEYEMKDDSGAWTASTYKLAKMFRTGMLIVQAGLKVRRDTID